MSKVENVEKRIWNVEGFQVHVLYREGTNVRGDRTGLPQYQYQRAAADDITVAAWKETRFRASYPGFEVDVLDRRGNIVQGNTKLGTVRASYNED